MGNVFWCVKVQRWFGLQEKIVPNEEDNYTNPLLEIYPKKILSTIKNIKKKRFKTRSEFLLCSVGFFFCSTIYLSDLKKKDQKIIQISFSFFYLEFISASSYTNQCVFINQQRMINSHFSHVFKSRILLILWILWIHYIYYCIYLLLINFAWSNIFHLVVHYYSINWF